LLACGNKDLQRWSGDCYWLVAVCDIQPTMWEHWRMVCKMSGFEKSMDICAGNQIVRTNKWHPIWGMITCFAFYPRHMHCCLSICLSNAWFVTNLKKVVLIFLYDMKDHSS